MWQVENTTPFEVAGNWVRSRTGAEIWVLAVRGTFDVLANGRVAVSARQSPPALGPVHFGDPATSSLRFDSDFHMAKPTTDILLHGHAYAPAGRPATRVDVTMRVGDVEKTLRVTGDRVFGQGLFGTGYGPAQPFERMPLRYERAYGGLAGNGDDPHQVEPLNPLGTGFAPQPGARAPNLAYQGREDKGPPACFGPLPPHWPQRLAHAGTYDEVWCRDRLPLYPDDLDDRFFLSAPRDQWPLAHLRGGEPVSLYNLDPTGLLQFALPRLAFRFETHFRGRQPVLHRGTLNSVILEPDLRQVCMVWHSALPAHADVHRLERTFVRQLNMINSRAGWLPAESLEEAA
ncbi:DUF2169 domain-containing protein [Paucibacter sp. R3-3]|uniref:DUF2169 domain-containing protein n=1 Tax=Roseateles agri TaxID=3098619 RepID=A0ABU5DAH5_9BURK|nr:DUF2169 domain-containing protein [Paucibacter sp. R3-3]MDY0743286.1 DUF2169 domain-containing protein [Paucibacter sp. R3-3]